MNRLQAGGAVPTWHLKWVPPWYRKSWTPDILCKKFYQHSSRTWKVQIKSVHIVVLLKPMFLMMRRIIDFSVLVSSKYHLKLICCFIAPRTFHFQLLNEKSKHDKKLLRSINPHLSSVLTFLVLSHVFLIVDNLFL